MLGAFCVLVLSVTVHFLHFSLQLGLETPLKKPPNAEIPKHYFSIWSFEEGGEKNPTRNSETCN